MPWFVAQAIDSALAQTHAGVEGGGGRRRSTGPTGVGSSRATTTRSLVPGPASTGARRARRRTGPKSGGEVVRFLMATMSWIPTPNHGSARGRRRIAKVQGRLDLIDDRGRGLGRESCRWPCPPATCLPWCSGTGGTLCLPRAGASASRRWRCCCWSRRATRRPADGRLSVSSMTTGRCSHPSGRCCWLPELLALIVSTMHGAPGNGPRARGRCRRWIERTATLSGIVRRWAGHRELRNRPSSSRWGIPTMSRSVWPPWCSIALAPRAIGSLVDTRARAGLAAAWTVPWSLLRMRIVQSIGFLALATLPAAAVDQLCSPLSSTMVAAVAEPPGRHGRMPMLPRRNRGS